MTMMTPARPDVLRVTNQHPLESLFRPHTVAVIGATDRPCSVGQAILANLLRGDFRGTVYPVNPHRDRLLGQKAYPKLEMVPNVVDLAVIATPAATVPGIIRECVQAGTRTAVVISAGFRERGPKGAELEQQIQREMRGSRLRLVGPNCLGIMNPTIGLNATFAQQGARSGNIAFLSQSGALCTAILDWSLQEMVGFSAFVSTGSMLDVGWGDLIYYFGDDPDTHSILLYMESVGDAQAFLSAAREVALTKPIVVIKPGRTAAAAKAAVSHTGSMTGADEVLDAAFRRCGVLRVENVAELFDIAELLNKQSRARGPKLMIVTNAGGPAVLAADTLVGGGGELSPISTATFSAFNKILPAHWSQGNPVDILGDADPDRYAAALRIAGSESQADGLLAIMAPQGMTDPTDVARQVAAFAGTYNKPFLASWMGAASVEEGIAVLNRAGIPTFAFPDSAARAFNYMWQYSRNLDALYETPAATEVPDATGAAQSSVAELIASIRAKGRKLLSEFEAKQILAIYGIATVPTRYGSTPEQAVAAAQDIGLPVAVKLHSETITHKARVGGVRLNVASPEAVRMAFTDIQEAVLRNAGPESFQGVTVQSMIQGDGLELILGSSLDAQFGPVLLFGAGGRLVEAIGDRALGLPPLNATLARRMVERTRIWPYLERTYGSMGVGLAVSALVKLSRLVVEQPWIREIDVNPVLLSADGLLALDARIVLHELDMGTDRLPRPAIRPYPTQYIQPWTLKDGTRIVVRPIRPEDEPLMIGFHENLSEHSVYMRYFQLSSARHRVSHDRLRRTCFIDYNREIALVALRMTEDGAQQIIGIGRLTKLHGRNEAEVALLIADAYQRRGLGTQLLRLLVQIGRDERLERLSAYMLADNLAMKTVVRRLGFVIDATSDPQVVAATLVL